MIIRGKLLLPDFKVKFVDENKVKDLRSKTIEVITGLETFACNKANNQEKVAMDIFADLISLIYKAPMILSYATPQKGSLIGSAFEYFFAYVIGRHTKNYDESNLQQFFDELESERKDLSELFKYIASLRDLFEALLYTPADTRPGYNFTSLASHLQLSSILVWLLQQQSVDLNYLRISALLHDLGKLFNPESHVTEGIKILEEVINNSSCLKNTLVKIKDLIEKHHSNLDSILNSADKLSSASERLSFPVNEGIKGEKLSQCYSKSTVKEFYECFEKIEKDENKRREEYEKLSKKLYKYVLKSQLNEKTLAELKESEKFFEYLKLDDIKIERKEQNVIGQPIGYLLYVDFPGIQKFITSFPNLRDMSFASLLVDFLTSTYVFAKVDKLYQKTKIPAEALLSAYGGHSYIIIRNDIIGQTDIISEIKKMEKLEVRELDIKLELRVVPFAYTNYVRNFNTIWVDLSSEGYKRYILDYKEEIFSLGFHKVCVSCGIRPATQIDKNGEELCDRCYFVRQNSISKGFMAKANATYVINGEAITPKDFSKYDISTYAMEFIAGYNSLEESKYIALVKADGNRGGEIFKSCATLSDYIDRSFRLDYGIKKAFYDTLKELINVSGVQKEVTKNLASRVLAGVLYIGGDDVMIMTPSLLAVPFAVRFFKKAEEETGFTFKVGVISVKTDHPVQFAYQAVDELMEKAKIKEENKSSIASLVFSSTLATRNVVDTEIENMTNGRSELLIRVRNPLDEVKELLDMLKLNFETLSNFYSSSDKEQIRDYLRPLEYIVEYAESKDREFLLTLIYLIRMRARVNNIIHEKILEFLLKHSKIHGDTTNYIPLYDYFFILKSIRVGI